MEMLRFFQNNFRFKGIIFTSSPSLISLAQSKGVLAIRGTKSLAFPLFNRRKNRYGLPLIRNMFLSAKREFDSAYYGYINSDILLPTAIFKILSILNYNRQMGVLSSNVLASRSSDVVRTRGSRDPGGSAIPAEHVVGRGILPSLS